MFCFLFKVWDPFFASPSLGALDLKMHPCIWPSAPRLKNSRLTRRLQPPPPLPRASQHGHRAPTSPVLVRVQPVIHRVIVEHLELDNGSIADTDRGDGGAICKQLIASKEENLLVAAATTAAEAAAVIGEVKNTM